MVEGINIWFIIKGLILTEVLTNAVRSWGIFESIRSYVKAYSPFIRKLLDCFECVSIWVGSFVVLYLTFFEVALITYILVFHRFACFVHNIYDTIDAYRAVKEKQL